MKTGQALLEQLQQALNAHNLEAFVACFAPDYQSAQPIHPERAFQGAEQVRKNWTKIFQDVPDIHAELLRLAIDGDTVWAEWHGTSETAKAQRCSGRRPGPGRSARHASKAARACARSAMGSADE